MWSGFRQRISPQRFIAEVGLVDAPRVSSRVTNVGFGGTEVQLHGMEEWVGGAALGSMNGDGWRSRV